MTSKTIKRMLDACYQAKRAREMLPPLPKGVLPLTSDFAGDSDTGEGETSGEGIRYQ